MKFHKISGEAVIFGGGLVNFKLNALKIRVISYYTTRNTTAYTATKTKYRNRPKAEPDLRSKLTKIKPIINNISNINNHLSISLVTKYYDVTIILTFIIIFLF